MRVTEQYQNISLNIFAAANETFYVARKVPQPKCL